MIPRRARCIPFRRRSLPDDLFRQPPVLREEQQPLRINVEPSGDRQAFQMLRPQAGARFAKVIRSDDEFNRRCVAGFRLSGDIPDRLVQNYRNEPALLFDSLRSKSDFDIRRDFGSSRLITAPSARTRPCSIKRPPPGASRCRVEPSVWTGVPFHQT